MTRPHCRNRPDRWQPAGARECDQDREAAATDDPVAEFARMVTALDARDHRTATEIRRRVYRADWPIIPPRSPSWQRGRA